MKSSSHRPRVGSLLLAAALLLLLGACAPASPDAADRATAVAAGTASLQGAQDAVSFPLLVPDPATLPADVHFDWAKVVPAGDQQSIHLHYTDGSQTFDLVETTIPAGFHVQPPSNVASQQIDIRGQQGFQASISASATLFAWGEGNRMVTICFPALPVHVVETPASDAGIVPMGRREVILVVEDGEPLRMYLVDQAARSCASGVRH